MTACLVCASPVQAEVDLWVTDFRFAPASVETLTYPDQVWFTLANYGPAANCDALMEFSLSRNAIVGDGDDQPLASFVHYRCLDPGTGVYDYLSTSERAQLTLPADASGDYYMFLRATPAWATDPDMSDNVTVATNRLTVPAIGSIYAVFANSSLAASNMTIYPGGYFEYNLYYGNSWRITRAGEGFTGTFTAPQAGAYKLRVRHGTSSSGSCLNNGYAPVSVIVNGTSVVSDYDVNANHNILWFTNDTWTVQANAGENTLQWVAGALCTHYWIQRIEITAMAPPPIISAFHKHLVGVMSLQITGQPGRTNVIEASEDMQSWTPVTNLHNATGVLEWITPPLTNARAFYRIVELNP
jgi:hypothetical protein